MYIKKVTNSATPVTAVVVDNLTSDSSTDALSAKQGNILNEKIENINVAGGTGAPEIAIQSEEPTGQEVLWIDEDELDFEDFIPEEDLENVDLNTLADKLHIGSGNLMANGPDHYQFGYVISIPYVANYYAVQYFTNATQGQVYTRLMYMGEWNEWTEITTKNEITIGQEFATNEYIDGKRVYKKIISCGALPNADSTTIETGLTTEQVIKMSGYARTENSGGIVIPLPYADATDVNQSVSINVYRQNIVIVAGIDRSNYTESYVTLEYIKNN